MPRILVIDDNESVCTALAALLVSYGFSVITAASGAEGITLVSEQAPDAAVIDVHMPKMTGIEVIRELRATGHNLPIWLMTGAHSAEVVRLAAVAGAEELLSKPFDGARLAAQIAEHLTSSLDGPTRAEAAI